MPTVLVIEDDHETRVSLRELLEGEGYTVLTATNGFEGYSVLQRTQQFPLVVLLDQNLPIANGDEFLELKAGNKRLEKVPVIVISAVPDRLGLEPGVVKFFRKPIRIPELLRVIREQFPATMWALDTPQAI